MDNGISARRTAIRSIAVVAGIGFGSYFGFDALKRDSDNRHLVEKRAYVETVRETINSEGFRAHMAARKDYMNELVEKHGRKGAEYANVSDPTVLRYMVETVYGPTDSIFGK